MTPEQFADLCNRLTIIENALQVLLTRSDKATVDLDDVATAVEDIRVRVFDLDLSYGDGFGIEN